MWVQFYQSGLRTPPSGTYIKCKRFKLKQNLVGQAYRLLTFEYSHRLGCLRDDVKLPRRMNMDRKKFGKARLEFYAPTYFNNLLILFFL